MAVVGAEALAVVGEPGANVLILGCGEDDVAIAVISVRRMKRQSVRGKRPHVRDDATGLVGR